MSKKKRREPITLRIERVDYPNRAIGVELRPTASDAVDAMLEIPAPYAQWERGRTIQAKGGIEGQVWRAKPRRTRDGVLQVDLLERLADSAIEKKAHCPHASRCGGCTYQTLSYEEELWIKAQQLQRLYAPVYDGTIPLHRSPLLEGYRNKMEYSFGDAEKGGELCLGLHRPKYFHEIVSTPYCEIVPGDFNRIRGAVEEFFRARSIPYYHKQRQEGLLRHLVLRASLSKKQLMLNLVTTSDDAWTQSLEKEFVQSLLALPTEFGLRSIYHTINDSIADAVIPEEVRLLYGNPDLEEEWGGLQFRVGPFSFFQPNAEGAARMMEQALDLCGDLTGKTVYDLYCGTGTISQWAAKRAQRVIGVEIVEEAVEKAKRSAEENGLANVRFVARDVLEELDALREKEETPDLIILDPPREGVHPKALAKILSMRAPIILYISCNPTTQVRDIQLSRAEGYKVESIQGYDQFPRTKHVECIALIQRVKS